MSVGRLNGVEKFSARGLSGFLRHNLSKLQNHDSQQHAFRPLGRPVFQSVPDFAEQPAPQVELVPVFYEPQPQAPVKAQPVSKPIGDDIPLANRTVAMEWQRRQQRLVAHVNASLPADCHVAAFHIVPTDVFEGEVGRFLMMACDFYSHCFANTMFLPTKSAGAAHFGLPQHPLVTNETQRADSRSRIIQLRTRMANEHNRVAAALERGDVALLFKQNNNRPDYKQELASICKSIAINALGLSAFLSHESRFNDVFDVAKS